MIQAIPKVTTFNEFMDWYPENSEYRYELHDGVIVQRPKPTGPHTKVASFIRSKLDRKIERLNYPYFIPRECIVKPNDQSGYEPDVIVLNEELLQNDPRWEKESTITKRASAVLIIEVVSTNWRDDYYKKFADYEAMGIGEYWVADYLALGGRKYIGPPKQPTISVYELIEGEYELKQFRGNDRILSPNFPELELTAEQVFAKGR
jgi:Uma2 family endonuclease